MFKLQYWIGIFTKNYIMNFLVLYITTETDFLDSKSESHTQIFTSQKHLMGLILFSLDMNVLITIAFFDSRLPYIHCS